MDIRDVEDEASYDWALGEIAACFEDEPAPGSEEAARFSVLVNLIDLYERRVHAIEDAPPVEVLRFCMEQSGRTQADLAALFGSRSRASEVLTGKRPLNLPMIARLSRAWGIPADALIGKDLVAA